MRKILLMTVLAAVCCLAFSQEAKGDVWTTSDIFYSPTLNAMYAYSDIQIDYSGADYYTISTTGYIYKNEEYQMMISAGVDQNFANAMAEVVLPYDPDAEYYIEANHEVSLTFTYQTGYYDYYDFVEYTYGDEVLYPYSYNFMEGPPTTVHISDIILGMTNSLFMTGGNATQPDHLWVASDAITSGACGRTERRITYQIVDHANRKVGVTPVREYFTSPPFTDSCSGLDFRPTTCFPNYLHKGKIDDQLWVGLPNGSCPSSIDPTCGATESYNLWQWCPRGYSPKTLATFTYDIRWGRIGINGRYTEWPIGGQFFP